MPLHVRISSPALTGAHARRQPSLSSTVRARVQSLQSRAVKTSSALLMRSHSSRVRRALGGASRAASAGEHPKSSVISTTLTIILRDG
eukprot:scaffold37353_cov65-Phaeocystis_antarctica.AAC.7